MTTGWQGSDLVIGCPAPTEPLLRQYGQHAVMTGGSVLVFSMEMPSEQIVMHVVQPGSY